MYALNWADIDRTHREGLHRRYLNLALQCSCFVMAAASMYRPRIYVLCLQRGRDLLPMSRNVLRSCRHLMNCTRFNLAQRTFLLPVWQTIILFHHFISRNKESRITSNFRRTFFRIYFLKAISRRVQSNIT